MTENRVVIYQEHLLSSLILGQANVDPDRMSAFLNSHAAEGWEVVTMEREIRRLFLFWKREGMVFVLRRERK